jgi:hypothetical protein
MTLSPFPLPFPTGLGVGLRVGFFVGFFVGLGVGLPLPLPLLPLPCNTLSSFDDTSCSKREPSTGWIYWTIRKTSKQQRTNEIGEFEVRGHEAVSSFGREFVREFERESIKTRQGQGSGQHQKRR